MPGGAGEPLAEGRKIEIGFKIWVRKSAQNRAGHKRNRGLKKKTHRRDQRNRAGAAG